MNNKNIFYFNIINRGGSLIALLRYFKACKNNKNNVIVYTNTEESDIEMIEEFKQIVEVHLLQNGEKYHAKVAVNCAIYEVFDEIFENIQAERYVFWAQVNPFYNGRYEDKKLLLKYDAFLAVSEYIKKCLVDKIPEIEDKISIAIPIVDRDEILKKASEEQNIIKKQDNIYNIVTIARYSPSKGYSENIEIANLLKQKGFNFRWYSLGFIPSNRKDFYEEMQKKIHKYNLENFVCHIGVDPNPYKYMINAHLNILFSIDEAWGLGITESKILGIPNIVSNVGGLIEQVINDENGKIYDIPQTNDEYNKIANDIIELLEDAQKYNNIVNNLKNFNYNIDEIIKIMDKCFYEDI